MREPRPTDSTHSTFRLGTSIASLAEETERRQRYIRLARAGIMVLVILGFGTWGFWHLTDGRHSLVECVYMTVVTISTVGFNEVIPIATDELRIFTMALILFGGASVLYFLTSVAAVVVEGDLVYRVWRRRHETRLRTKRDHVLVCGLGLTGRRTFASLTRARTTAVGIDRDAERVEQLIRTNSSDVLFVVGDAFDEATLRVARIERARGLVAAFADDRDNLLLCVTARQLNPGLRVVSRLIDPANADMFDGVVSALIHPPSYGGARIANTLLRPELVAFTDALVGDESHHRHLEEIVIARDAPAAERTLGEVGLEARSGCLAVGLRLSDEERYDYHPPPEARLEAGGAL
ncbi:MAG: NAD-binding protein, partial [Myxococcales bacterium]|nr:NAD-binding protein [Myxococcales bacterium]